MFMYLLHTLNKELIEAPFINTVLLLIKLNISIIHKITIFLEEGISGKAYDKST